MANHVINFDPYNPASVARANATAQRLTNEFNRKVNTFIERIVQLVSETLIANYRGGVTVTVEPIENGFSVKASGKAVVFLEFGAGDLTNSANRYAYVDPQLHVYRGSWSIEESKTHEYALTGKWLFGGREYQYIVPTNAMQKAYEAVMQQYESIARSVFG